jgi:hemerythrin-like domain-containing protein
MAMAASGGLHPALQMLVDEHRVILRVIGFMTDRADDLDDDAEVDCEALRDCVAFLRGYADARHHGKEEGILFGEARGRDAGAAGLIDEMTNEHVDARGRVSAFEFAVEDYAEAGADRADRAGALAEAIRDVEALYAEHIEREDALLFPMIQDVLDASTLDGLHGRFVKADAAMAGTLELASPAVADLLD